jgi:acyl-CoA thioesterase-1
MGERVIMYSDWVMRLARAGRALPLQISRSTFLSAFGVALLIEIVTPFSGEAATARIVAFGDSNTYGMRMPRSEAYPAQLESHLKADGYDVEVVNEGRPGATTSDALATVGSSVPAGTRIAIVEFGVNDANRGTSPTIIESNLAKVVTHLKSQHVQVIICSRHARFPAGYDEPSYMQAFARVARSTGAKLYNFTQDIPASGFAWGGHENATGTAIVAANLSRIIMPMIPDTKRR